MSGRAASAEPASVAELLEQLGAGARPDFLFFWGHTARGPRLGRECLSQWYPASFVVEGVHFATAEHFMMYRKAMLFGDEAAAARILSAGDPGAAKSLGRSVRQFDERVWARHRFEIVVAGSFAKFSQNVRLGAFLGRTGNSVLVEASPRDTIWGIGMGESNESARDPALWRGSNLLGFALMRARAMLEEARR